MAGCGAGGVRISLSSVNRSSWLIVVGTGAIVVDAALLGLERSRPTEFEMSGLGLALVLRLTLRLERQPAALASTRQSLANSRRAGRAAHDVVPRDPGYVAISRRGRLSVANRAIAAFVLAGVPPGRRVRTPPRRPRKRRCQPRLAAQRYRLVVGCFVRCRCAWGRRRTQAQNRCRCDPDRRRQHHRRSRGLSKHCVSQSRMRHLLPTSTDPDKERRPPGQPLQMCSTRSATEPATLSRQRQPSERERVSEDVPIGSVRSSFVKLSERWAAPASVRRAW